MTKKEIIKEMFNETYSNKCQYLYDSVRKEAFDKAYEIYNTISHTKGKEFMNQAYGIKEYRY